MTSSVLNMFDYWNIFKDRGEMLNVRYYGKYWSFGLNA